MKKRIVSMLWIIALIPLAGISLYAQQDASKKPPEKPDTSPHTVQFIPVEKNVKLEVLDWGGTGRPLVFLAGLGNTAHIFDTFAPKFTPAYHVYGITRRGVGASSAPAPEEGNYAADRLGDDVLAVIEALKLDRPVLVGHSLAGEELSSIGSRYPEKVSGLIYLDAGYSYANYNASQGDLLIDSVEMRKKLALLMSGRGPRELKPLVQELLQTSLPQLEKDLQALQKQLQSLPDSTKAGTPSSKPPQMPPIGLAILKGQEKYTQIKCPILAIFADPHDFSSMFKNDPTARAAAETMDRERTSVQVKAFEAGIPSAQVILLPNANHYVFKSNEADVFRDMNAFLAKLPERASP